MIKHNVEQPYAAIPSVQRIQHALRTIHRGVRPQSNVKDLRDVFWCEEGKLDRVPLATSTAVSGLLQPDRIGDFDSEEFSKKLLDSNALFLSDENQSLMTTNWRLIPSRLARDQRKEELETCLKKWEGMLSSVVSSGLVDFAGTLSVAATSV